MTTKVWTPEDELLGTYQEFIIFAHEISYHESTISPITGLPVDTYYRVRIIPQEINPPTVLFHNSDSLSNTDPAKIYGHFEYSFQDILQYRNFEKKLITVDTLSPPAGNVFTKIDQNEVDEVISFKADLTRTRTFHYLAQAFVEDFSGVTIIDEKTYTIIVQDLNWTPGQTALKNLVNLTKSR